RDRPYPARRGPVGLDRRRLHGRKAGGEMLPKNVRMIGERSASVPDVETGRGVRDPSASRRVERNPAKIVACEPGAYRRALRVEGRQGVDDREHRGIVDVDSVPVL